VAKKSIKSLSDITKPLSTIQNTTDHKKSIVKKSTILSNQLQNEISKINYQTLPVNNESASKNVSSIGPKASIVKEMLTKNEKEQLSNTISSKIDSKSVANKNPITKQSTIKKKALNLRMVKKSLMLSRSNQFSSNLLLRKTLKRHQL